MITKRRILVLLTIVLVAVAFAPQNADACPVCFSAKPGAREAFLGTTAFLTFFPLGIIGSLLFWFRKHLQKKEK